MNGPRPQPRRLSHFLAASALVAAFAPAFGGCSEPAPLIPRGAWAVQFVRPDNKCKHTNHNLGIGEVTATTRQTLIEDGAEDTVVGCSVIDNGGSFYFDANASNKVGNALTMIVPELAADASIDAPAIGTVSYLSTSNTATTFSSDKCNFYFEDGTPQAVSAGNIFVAFDCPEIAAAIDDVCQIQKGYAVFENCSSKNDSE